MPFEDLLRSHLQKMDQRKQEFLIPDFPSSRLTWFNSKPLSFAKELRGKIVVLDFWTYCCINCMHVLPDLAALEAKYAPDPVVFIGIHSAKFPNEKNPHNLRQAILRYNIHHPVVNDPEMEIWNRFGVHSWPTLAVIGPYGNLLFSASGEGHRESLDAFITAALDYYRLSLKDSPIPYALEEDSHHSLLRFPGKLATSSDFLFISDSNHNRILVSSFNGHIQEIIGSSTLGLKDGHYQEAQFNRLQGLAYYQQKLYVADTENHALRQVDLIHKTVTTLAGDGRQGQDYQGGAKGTDQKLSTPWDLAISANGEKIYIAMAGTHQIWIHDLTTGRTSNLSGSGAEQNLNSHHLLSAAWAQPSGITLSDHCLYLADSESSSIRMIDLIQNYTSTLVGGDASNPSNLFSFGDVDGKGILARLQHPLGVIWWEAHQNVIVADTYNHRLKLVDPKSKTIKSWIGSGKVGHQDGKGLETSFAEPSGFAWHPDGKTLFVADTNNHAIRVVNTETADVHTLTITE